MRKRPTKKQLHLAITIGIATSCLLAYFGFEFYALVLGMPSNIVWVWEGEVAAEL